MASGEVSAAPAPPTGTMGSNAPVAPLPNSGTNSAGTKSFNSTSSMAPMSISVPAQFQHPCWLDNMENMEKTDQVEGGTTRKKCCGRRQFECSGCDTFYAQGETNWYKCKKEECHYHICEVCVNLGPAEGGRTSTASLTGFAEDAKENSTTEPQDTYLKRQTSTPAERQRSAKKEDSFPKRSTSSTEDDLNKGETTPNVKKKNPNNNNNKKGSGSASSSSQRVAAASFDFGLNHDDAAKVLWDEFSRQSDPINATEDERGLLTSARHVASYLRFLELTVLSPAELKAEQLTGLKTRCLMLYSPLAPIPYTDKMALIEAARKVPEANRSMGSIVGMACGDALGAPFEFLDATDEELGHHRFDLKNWKIIGPRNKFKVSPGQWTDDTSMGLCLADTILAKGGYDGSDVRVRYHNWWFRGYNNAFGNDNRIGSVGLGGNVAQSLRVMVSGERPSAAYEAVTQDAGNGTIMRLAPMPIFCSSDAVAAAKNSAASSFATHPGPIAAAACAFQGYVIARAIRRRPEDPNEAAAFLDKVVEEFIRAGLPGADGCPELQRLLASAEPRGGREECWNWKAPRLPIQSTLRSRGRTYNGYPCNPDYFGSYCIDGLAVALWSVYHTQSYVEAIVRCTNFLGDADTTSAVCGQIAGAFYGYDGIDKRCLTALEKWDDLDIACRGVLLWALQTWKPSNGNAS